MHVSLASKSSRPIGKQIDHGYISRRGGPFWRHMLGSVGALQKENHSSSDGILRHKRSLQLFKNRNHFRGSKA